MYRYRRRAIEGVANGERSLEAGVNGIAHRAVEETYRGAVKSWRAGIRVRSRATSNRDGERVDDRKPKRGGVYRDRKQE